MKRPLIFFTIPFILSASVAADKYVTDPNQLIGNSAFCSQQKLQVSALCRRDDSPMPELGGVQQIGNASKGLNFSTSLKSKYVRRIRSSLKPQYAAVMWFGDTNPTSGSQGQRLINSMNLAQEKCKSSDGEIFPKLKSDLENIDPLKELGFQNSSADEQQKSKEMFLKRMTIAWMELSRIEKNLERPLTKQRKNELKIKAAKIRDTYPVITTAHGSFSLRQVVNAQYSTMDMLGNDKEHPDINKILFADEQGKYSEIKAGTQVRSGIEGQVNQILSQPLSPQVKKEVLDLMRSSLKNSFESVGAFCELNSCQLMQLSLNKTANQINNLYIDNAKVAAKAICDCNLMATTEYVGGGIQLALAGATIGGLVLCPFTFGAGCYAATAAGAALTGIAVANTYGAISDSQKFDPVYRTGSGLPGLSNEDRRRIQKTDNNNAGRIMLGSAELALGAVPIIGLATKGKRTLTAAEAAIAQGASKVPAATRPTIFSKTENIPDATDPLVHVPNATGHSIPTEDWIEWFKKITKDKKTLQDEWTNVSQNGQIWTAPTSRPYSRNLNQSMYVRFGLKPNYTFFDSDDLAHVQEWQKWITANSKVKNTFSVKQIEELKKANQPYHSEFYRQNQLAGIRINNGSREMQADMQRLGFFPDAPRITPTQGSYWNVVNFDAVNSATLTVPQRTGLPIVSEFLFP